ncbi:hypothetical protein KO516_22715 [Citreicella sp. C3M06]|uniref:alpha/beta hydrolase n=1 Tax=Citreicella sp. C3M06 TaxID=2841564 RepID=UPI001C083211|nr:alpha/beta hydrolase-fold protein [Citreicella sp. C3M06]MBU2963589.1 hypothetical protein [Citreicella sp. C3M06]
MRLLALILMLLPLGAAAQPSPDPLGPSILVTGSTVVDTDSFDLPGPDGASMPYRIGVLIPKGPAPEGGFPVLFALDGQAVLELLSDDFLGSLDAPLPVIVTLGYDTDQRFAGDERTRDYTPASADGSPVADPRGRPGGGAATFLSLLTDKVVPEVQARASIDMRRSALWGHSYAGLFVLYAAGEASSPFARYIAASPSLWWDNGSFLARLSARVGNWPHRPLDVHKGELERERASNPSNANAQKLVRMRAALPEDALGNLNASLRAAGVPGRYTVFDGLSHGETFRQSIRFVLETGSPATGRP